jgi:uncharacterized protein YfaP (DUF2135 family)
MDLHVTEPNGTQIYYGNRGPTATGGALDVDVLCSGSGGIENVVWGEGSSPDPGTYTVWVDEYAQCGQGPAAWRLEVFVGDRRVLTRSGTGEGPTDITFTVG